MSGSPIQRLFERTVSYKNQANSMIFKVTLDKKIHLIKLSQSATIEDLKKSISQSFKLPQEGFSMCYVDEEGDDITLNDQHDYAILTASELKTMKVKVQVIEAEVEQHSVEPPPEEQDVVVELNSSIDPFMIEPVKEESKVEEPSFQVEESLIEEKLKKLLPSFVAKVKTEIEEEQLERSRVYDQNQPLIIEQMQRLPKQVPIPVKPLEEENKIPSQDKTVRHIGVRCDGCGAVPIQGIRYKCAVCADFDFCETCEASTEHIHPFLKIRTLQQTPVKIIAVVRDQENNFEVNGFKIPPQAGFENLLQKGMSFLSSLGGQQQQQQQQQRCNPDPRCAFFQNLIQSQFQKCAQRCPQKQEKKEETVQEPKQQEKKMEEKGAQVNEEVILENAQYLAQYGLEFNKCYSWARTYPSLSKEELLQSCLSAPGFLEEQ